MPIHNRGRQLSGAATPSNTSQVVCQAALSLQQNVNLPNGVMPQIQGSSLVGEVFRYQVVGPPHFGLTNLR
jgi:cobalt-zinc-cadmium resistance protein CzcA